MAAVDELRGFAQRYHTISQQRDTTDRLIEELLLYCERTERQLREEKEILINELRDCRLDLQDAVNTRREHQQRLQKYEESYQWLCKEHNDLRDRNPYVLLLIDGDGLIFKDHWIRQGVEGGKNAAYALRSAISKQCGDRADSVEIVAKVIANLSGLTRAMQKDGCIDNPSLFKDFTLGFTQAKASFDFIDVGKGKERADSKIKELARWHLQNHNCKQVLLGISHDSGYAPFLDELFQDEKVKARLTIIEGVPLVKELEDTKAHTLALPGDLFRNDKLQDRTTIVTRPPASAPPAPSAANVYASPASSTSSAIAPTASLNNTSYATITSSASPPPQITMPLPPKAPLAKTRPATQSPAQTKTLQQTWNPGPRGLDEPIIFNAQAMEEIRKRKDTKKLCNNHYLRGPCNKEDCAFVHNYQPSKEEINAIAVLARLNPCTNGQDCLVDSCIYGHNCPSIKDGVCCHPYCKFPESLHPPGTRYKNAHIKANKY
ncbi:hypothetical protein B0I35DRAFT_428782 [Stachybotrys elegans]|uniref:C3H1-type domain-containing protein n=1 Tax=Stachybotrys elegans TaxID=80388 RepID=A0A8K0WU28_9HYPO|nr:hypothetical protein B0I35DRAFT_428782 [Stachybotrys elegans]